MEMLQDGVDQLAGMLEMVIEKGFDRGLTGLVEIDENGGSSRKWRKGWDVLIPCEIACVK